MAKIPVAVQLYTLREEQSQDFVGTLQKVAQIGYDGVEFAGFGGLSGSELRRIVGDLGLRVAGAHVGYRQLAEELNEVIDYNLAIGNPWVVCPSLPSDQREDLDGYRRAGEFFSGVAAELARHGLGFAYHNHAFEFERVDGVSGYDAMFAAADAGVKAEIDTYWVEKAGENVVETIRKYAGRVPLLHVKDMTGDEERTFAEVGEGIMDFQAICGAAADAGTEWFIVEQDRCQSPPLECVATSLRNLRRILG